MLKTLKRKIALVAVSVLGASGLAVIAAPAANAAATTNTITATVSPIRVSLTNNTVDAVPAGKITFTLPDGLESNTLADADTISTLTVLSAPTATAEITIDDINGTTAETKDTLGAGGTATTKTNALAGDLTEATEYSGLISLSANAAPGTYVGRIVFYDDGTASGDEDTVTVNFSFTTVGAPASWTLTQTSSSVLKQGVDTATVTLKDSNGNTTQPGAFDSFTLAATTSTIVDKDGDADTTLSATELRTGTASLTFTAHNSNHVSTVTVTPAGVLPFQGLSAKTLTYTVSGEVVATSVTALSVTAPSNAVNEGQIGADTAADADADGSDVAAAIPAGTSTVTVSFTHGTASAKVRWKVSGTAGTINGSAATTAQYFNIDADTAGKGTLTLTLGGSALIETTAVTVEQVTVANGVIDADGAAVGNQATDIVITQTARAMGVGTITMTPTGSNIAKLGTAAAPTSTSVVVSVKDQFGDSVGAGYVVRAYRGSVANANLLATSNTAADGTATVAVIHATTLVAAGAETYNFTATVGATTVTATANLTINYTADGAITGMTTTVEDDGNAAMGTTNLAAAAGLVAATTQAIYPVIEIPADGTASDADFDGIYTVSSAAVTKVDGTTAYDVATGGELVTLNTDTTPNNAAEYSTSEGLFLCKTTSCAWNAGLTSAIIADATDVYVFGTKTGIGTVTIKSGGLTREVKVFVKNAATNFYTLTASPATASVAGGAYGAITVSVKDIFGNAVDTGANDLAVTAEGAVLLGGMAASTTTGTGAAGTATVTYIGNNTGGSGTITIEGVPTTGAWATGYTKPTGAGDPSKKATVALTVTAASAAANPEITAVKADVKAVSDTVATLSKAVTTIQSSVTELTSSFSAQIKSLSAAIAKISRAIAALSKKIK